MQGKINVSIFQRWIVSSVLHEYLCTREFEQSRRKVAFKPMNKWTKKISPSLVVFSGEKCMRQLIFAETTPSCRKIFFMMCRNFCSCATKADCSLSQTFLMQTAGWVSENGETMISLSKAIGWSTGKVTLALQRKAAAAGRGHVVIVVVAVVVDDAGVSGGIGVGAGVAVGGGVHSSELANIMTV